MFNKDDDKTKHRQSCGVSAHMRWCRIWYWRLRNWLLRKIC